MALTSWKQFNFFDVTQVPPPDPTLFESSSFSSLASGSESLFLGTQDGRVHILNSSLKAIRTFAAYPSSAGPVTQLKQVAGTSLLLTIAENLSEEPLLKVWALDNLDKKTQSPKCLSELRIQNQRKPFPISAFAALDDLSQLAVGFANGAVTVVRGDLIHDRGAKQRTVFESEEPITGVAFRERSRNTTLYLATTGRILTLTITGKGQGSPPRPLEDIGCGADCMTVDRRSGEVVVVRNDAVYYYGVGGRGPSFAYEGSKKLVRTFGDYVCVVQPPQKSKQTSSKFLGSADEYLSASTFTLLDADLKYVAHRETINAEVRTVFSEWGDLWVLTMDGKLYKYHEKSLQQKLDILYARNLYVLAINFAQKAKLDISQRNIILRRYGDHLYQKGDYDTAMQQYLKAIDNTEPSQVIRKFLDTQRIHNLIQYLEELHEHDKATIDHTTLLLNCYAKLKDTDKLEAFIKSGNNFDFDTAITMCRQGGYYDQAVYLAKKHGEHGLVVDILVEDSKAYEEALDYIARLEPDICYPSLMKYARVLLEHCPKDTTQLFIDYYTGNYRLKVDEVKPPQLVPSGSGSAIPGLTSFIPLAYRSSSSTATPTTQGGGQVQKLEGNEALEAAAAAPPPKYDIPKPRTAFSAFVDHPENFVTFLEAILAQEHVPESDKTDLYTTLFEMYLAHSKNKPADQRSLWESKARMLIDNKKVFIDPSNVLLLSHLSSFRDGTILVREQQGLRADIFRSYTSAKDTQGAIKALHKYGPEEPALYTAALAYLTSSRKILEEAGDELDAVLRKIQTDRLMAPLQVVQMLGKNDVASVGLVRKYLGGTIEKERKEIESNRRLADSYRTATNDKRKELRELSTKPKSINNNRCSSCGGSLDLPKVHYLCNHSFHQRCLNVSSTGSKILVDAQINRQGDHEDDEPRPECPVCEKDNEMIRMMRKAQIDTASKHDMFLDAMSRSRDGLATVSEFFGRGVMGGHPGT